MTEKPHNLSDEQKDIRVGRTTYPLRAGVTLSRNTSESTGQSTVEAAGLEMRGEGASVEEALLNWSRQFHTLFQTLMLKRPLEMSEEERQVWDVIAQIVDVPKYHANTPFILQEIGTVEKIEDHTYWIRWENDRVTKAKLEQLPAEFAAYQIGQRFEAMVRRAPMTFKLQKIFTANAIEHLSDTNDESKDDLWDSIPTSRSLPEAQW